MAVTDLKFKNILAVTCKSVNKCDWARCIYDAPFSAPLQDSTGSEEEQGPREPRQAFGKDSGKNSEASGESKVSIESDKK